MEWAKPLFSRSKIDRAGETLINPAASPEQVEEALEIINNWRSSHQYPLNTFKVTLRRKSAEVDANRLVAQRIKRLTSIDMKLKRFNKMRLARMQDIGGCRAIVADCAAVIKLVEKYKNSDIKHKLVDEKDYIAHPQSSGYRGIHLIYEYNSDKEKPSVYNGLLIEMQLRSRIQHAWATAVETVGTFLRQSLKSSQGEHEWLRFFSLMSSVIATIENTPIVPNTPQDREELIKEVRSLSKKLEVVNTLHSFRHALNIAEERMEGQYFFILKLEAALGKMTITSFAKREMEEASKAYLEIEKEIAEQPGADAVLVSADSFQALRTAFPNYFLDTVYFLQILEDAIRN